MRQAYSAAFGLATLVCVAGGLGAATSQVPGASQTPAPFDLLIINGRLADGSGNPWRRADVGVRGGRIAAVGALAGLAASETIDANGRVVAPGFIDAHSHALDALGREAMRGAEGLLAQGVTTVIGNPDGGGPVDLAAQATALEAGGIGVNAALLIGHGSVRGAVLGQADRQPSAAQLAEMEALVSRARAAGAFGLSSGLFYVPGRFARADEVIRLARAAGGVHTSHIRDEGSYDAGVIASVDEVIAIARAAGVRGVVTHVKALGPESWGKSREMIKRIEAARRDGLEIYADQYPYTASSTSLPAAVMPGQATEAAREAMSAPASRAAFLSLVRDNVRRRGGAESIVIASGRGAAEMAGQHLAAIAAARGVTPEEAAVAIVLDGGASIVSFNMSDDDVDALMRQPWTMASSDGGLVAPGAGRPHPRSQGAFARRLSHYVRGRGVLRLEDAIRGMTSLTAQVFALPARGEIRPGAWADLVIFDPDRVVDRATYADPFADAAGIDWVLVNGQVARRDGKATGLRAGQVLRPADARSPD